jgi:hypothetical protein
MGQRGTHVNHSSNSLPTTKRPLAPTRGTGDRARRPIRLTAIDRWASVTVAKRLQSFAVGRIPDAVDDHANGVSTMQQLDDPTESPAFDLGMPPLRLALACRVRQIRLGPTQPQPSFMAKL